MLKIKYIVPVLALALSAVAALFFAACQPEDLNSDLPKGAIRLVAPDYRPSDGTKLGVDEYGAQVFFAKGDRIWVNGQNCEIDVINGTAYIVPSSVSYPLRMVYPYDIVDRTHTDYSTTSDNIPLKLPGQYTYTTVQEGPGAGRQNVPAPLCAKIEGTNEGQIPTKAFFKHITAAITIVIHNPSNGDMEITGASITSEMNMLLAKPITIDISQDTFYRINTLDQEQQDTDEGKFQTISVKCTTPLTIPANQEGYIQVPVLSLRENSAGRPKLTVQVSAVSAIGGVYPFEMVCKKTQSNTSSKFVLNQGELAYAPIDFAPGDLSVDGLFSVDQNKKVYFSKGNLRYRIPDGANNSTPDALAHYTNIANWAFFESQDSTIEPKQQYNIGKAASNMTPFYMGEDENQKWMSLFQFGATGHSVLPRLLPLYATAWYNNLSSPHPGRISDTNIAAGGHDWGSRVNGKYGGTWVTLSVLEWKYLLEGRVMEPGTASGSSPYQGSRPRFLKANISGKVGLIIFPDKYWAEGRIYPGQIDINNPMSNVEWDYLQKAGVVFLPPTGRIVRGARQSGSNAYYYAQGDEVPPITLYYWTCSGTGSHGKYLKFAAGGSESSPGFLDGYGNYVHHSAAVRLVRLAQ